MDEATLIAALTADPEDDVARGVYADWLEEHGHTERAADLRLEMVKPTVRAALDALLARLEVATDPSQRVAAMMRSANAARRARMRGWTELVGQAIPTIRRADDPVATLVGLANAATDPEVRAALAAWLAEHGTRAVPMRVVTRLGEVTRSAAIAILEGPTAQGLLSVAVVPSGRCAVTSTFDGELFVFDLVTGACEQLAPPMGEIKWWRLVAHPTRDLVYAGLADDTRPILDEWDLTTNQRVRTFEGHRTQIRQLATDGVHLVAGNLDYGSELSIWNLATGERLGIPSDPMSSAIALRGDRVYCGTRDGDILEWSIATRALVRTTNVRPQYLDDASVRALAVGDHERVFAGLNYGIIVIEQGGQARRQLSSHQQEIRALLLAGDRLVSASEDATLRIWDLAAGKPLQILAGHAGIVYDAKLHPDGNRVVSCGLDGTLRVWDIEHALELPRDAIVPTKVDWITPVDESRVLVGGNESPVACLRLDGQPGWRHAQVCGPLVVHGDIAVARSFHGYSAQVRSLADGTRLRYLESDDPVSSVAVHPADRIVLGSSRDNMIYVWNLDTNQETRWFGSGHSVYINEVIRLEDGRRFVSASQEAIRVWDLATGAQLHVMTGHTMSTRILAVGERLVSWSQDDTLRVWDLASGQQLWCVPQSIERAAALGDGRRVVLATKTTLALLDVAALQVTAPRVAHRDEMLSIAVGERFIATTSKDRDVAIWSHELAPLACWYGRGPNAIAWVTPDRLAVAEPGGEVVILSVDIGA